MQSAKPSKFKVQNNPEKEKNEKVGKSLHQKTHEKVDREEKGDKVDRGKINPIWVTPKTPRANSVTKDPRDQRGDYKPEVREKQTESQIQDWNRERESSSPSELEDIKHEKIYSISSIEETEDLKDLLRNTLSICNQIASLHLESAKCNLETARHLESLSKTVETVNELYCKQLQENRQETENRSVRPKTPSREIERLSQTISLPLYSRSVVKKLKQ